MKTGFITLIGRPNAGKSTLINRFVGEKVSIVTWRPQTTRNKITGVLNGEGYQAIFVDTPGLHSATDGLSRYMMQSIEAALDGIDCLLYLCDVARGVSREDLEYLSKAVKTVPAVVVAVNKTDCVAKETLFAELTKLNATEGIKAIVPVSAKRGDNTDKLLKLLTDLLPEGEPQYSEDVLTDKSTRFMCGEIIREKALKLLEKEIPYGISVLVTKFEQRADKPIYDINADIVCDRKNHKSVIIGKGGSMLKKIATEARVDMEELLETKVFLTLYVKADEGWRDSAYLLNELGYGE